MREESHWPPLQSRPPARRVARPRRASAPTSHGFEPPGGAADRGGPGRRQHGRLRVREPGPAGHGHDHGELHPARGACRRAELRQVRRRRPLRAQGRQHGRRREDISYEFRFARRPATRTRSSTTPARSTTLSDTDWNRPQFYSVTPRRRATTAAAADARRARAGRADAAGQHRPALDAELRLADGAPRSATLPGGGKVFAGQIDDPFFVDLGSIFDLAGLRPFNPAHRSRSPAARRRRRRGRLQHAHDRDPGADRAADARTADADAADDPTPCSASTRPRAGSACTCQNGRRRTGAGDLVQVSRLANPLVNEVVIPLGKKDRWNASDPSDDAAVRRRVPGPEVTRLENGLYPVLDDAPETSRDDLAAILLTGVDLGLAADQPQLHRHDEGRPDPPEHGHRADRVRPARATGSACSRASSPASRTGGGSRTTSPTSSCARSRAATARSSARSSRARRVRRQRQPDAEQPARRRRRRERPALPRRLPVRGRAAPGLRARPPRQRGWAVAQASVVWTGGGPPSTRPPTATDMKILVAAILAAGLAPRRAARRRRRRVGAPPAPAPVDRRRRPRCAPSFGSATPSRSCAGSRTGARPPRRRADARAARARATRSAPARPPTPPSTRAPSRAAPGARARRRERLRPRPGSAGSRSRGTASRDALRLGRAAQAAAPGSAAPLRRRRRRAARARPLPRGLRDLRPHGRAEAERVLVRARLLRPRAARRRRRSDRGDGARARRLDRPARGLRPGSPSSSASCTGRSGASRRAPRTTASRFSVVPGYVPALDALARVEAARGHSAARSRSQRRAVESIPLPSYVAQLGDLLASAGRTAEAREQYALVASIERLQVANGVKIDLETALYRTSTTASGCATRSRSRVVPGPSGRRSTATTCWRGPSPATAAAPRRSSTRSASLRLGTRDATFYFHRGMIERCLGRPAAARSWFARAARAEPALLHPLGTHRTGGTQMKRLLVLAGCLAALLAPAAAQAHPLGNFTINRHTRDRALRRTHLRPVRARPGRDPDPAGGDARARRRASRPGPDAGSSYGSTASAPLCASSSTASIERPVPAA